MGGTLRSKKRVPLITRRGEGIISTRVARPSGGAKKIGAIERGGLQTSNKTKGMEDCRDVRKKVESLRKRYGSEKKIGTVPRGALSVMIRAARGDSNAFEAQHRSITTTVTS